MNNPELPQLLSLHQVSARTSLSRSTLYREIDAGRLKSVKIGKSVRISERALKDFIEALSNAGA
jgi:excisionase family DNA binding protein